MLLDRLRDFLEWLSSFSPRWRKNLRGLDGKKMEIQQGKPLYIIAVFAPDGSGDKHVVRLATHSADHFRSKIKRFYDEDVLYLARRTGRRMRDIKSFAVFSRNLGELVRKKEDAFTLIAKVPLR